MRLTSLIVALAFTSFAYAAELTLVVDGGKEPRTDAIVTFAYPPGMHKKADVVDAAGVAHEVALLPDGRRAVVLPKLPAGETKFELRNAGEPAVGVRATREGNNVTLTHQAKPILRYQGDLSPLPDGYKKEFQRGGYVHPVHTPTGRVVTDDYPPNHKHHHGIWAPWTKTRFEGREPDFWNMGDAKGTVEFVELANVFSGGSAAGLVAKHRQVDLTAKPERKVALNETWELVAYNVTGPYRVFDLTIRQECATTSPLELPKYHYGGLGFRGARAWDKRLNATFLTSEGKERMNGNETRGRWCRISGKSDGELCSVTVMDHPSNFRHPQPMRLHPDEPFFCFAPQQLGDFAIEPGKPYVVRYRFVVADGELPVEQIERLWNQFASPPKAEVR
jgi:hypothetical protein